MVYWRIVDGVCNFRMEKPLSAQCLVSYCGEWEDSVKSHAVVRGLACDFSEESFGSP